MTNNIIKGDDLIKKINIVLNILLIVLLTIGGVFLFTLPVNQNTYISITKDSNLNTDTATIVEVSDFGNFVNDLEYSYIKYREVDVKVVEDITYAMLYIYLEGSEMKVKVQIVEDYKNGERYHVKNDFLDLWVSPNRLEIIYEDDVYPLSALSSVEAELYINYQDFDSLTDYLLWVDIKRQVVNVFKKMNGYFFLIEEFPCATGKTSTPTKRGLFTLYDKGEVFYNEEKQYKCYNWFKYHDKYLLHSIPYTYDEMPLNTSMQKKVSAGCIRLKYNDSKWLYNNIPLNTTLWVN